MGNVLCCFHFKIKIKHLISQSCQLRFDCSAISLCQWILQWLGQAQMLSKLSQVIPTFTKSLLQDRCCSNLWRHSRQNRKDHCSAFITQSTLEHPGFELRGSTYTWTCSNKDDKCIFSFLCFFKNSFLFSSLLYCKNIAYNTHSI